MNPNIFKISDGNIGRKRFTTRSQLRSQQVKISIPKDLIATKHNEVKVKHEELSRLKLNIDKFLNSFDEPKKSIAKEIAKKKEDKKITISSVISKEI